MSYRRLRRRSLRSSEKDLGKMGELRRGLVAGLCTLACSQLSPPRWSFGLGAFLLTTNASAFYRFSCDIKQQNCAGCLNRGAASQRQNVKVACKSRWKKRNCAACAQARLLGNTLIRRRQREHAVLSSCERQVFNTSPLRGRRGMPPSLSILRIMARKIRRAYTSNSLRFRL